jgi:hypothetical protein
MVQRPANSTATEEVRKDLAVGMRTGRIHEIALLKQKAQVRLVLGIWCSGL